MTETTTLIEYHGKTFVVNGLRINQALGNYRGGIRAAVRGLWSGAFGLDDFVDAMFTTIDLGIVQAWNEGAREVGVQPNELTPEERIARRQMIQNERQHVFNFGLWIEENSRENGGKLGTVFNRAEKWILRARDAKNNGMLSARADPKLTWIYDETKEHCRTCAKLHLKTKRKSFWERIGVKPQNAPNPQLE